MSLSWVCTRAGQPGWRGGACLPDGPRGIAVSRPRSLSLPGGTSVPGGTGSPSATCGLRQPRPVPRPFCLRCLARERRMGTRNAKKRWPVRNQGDLKGASGPRSQEKAVLKNAGLQDGSPSPSSARAPRTTDSSRDLGEGQRRKPSCSLKPESRSAKCREVGSQEGRAQSPEEEAGPPQRAALGPPRGCQGLGRARASEAPETSGHPVPHHRAAQGRREPQTGLSLPGTPRGEGPRGRGDEGGRPGAQRP